MPSAVTGRFRRSDRILKSRSFRRVIGRGDRSTSRNFVVFLSPNAGSGSDAEMRGRIGITVSKRVGNSVVRNRVKRRIREWYRHSRGRLPIGSEIVVIARHPARELETQVLFEDLDRIVRSTVRKPRVQVDTGMAD